MTADILGEWLFGHIVPVLGNISLFLLYFTRICGCVLVLIFVYQCYMSSQILLTGGKIHVSMK